MRAAGRKDRCAKTSCCSGDNGSVFGVVSSIVPLHRKERRVFLIIFSLSEEERQKFISKMDVMRNEMEKNSKKTAKHQVKNKNLIQAVSKCWNDIS